jgi:hypothetical protein
MGARGQCGGQLRPVHQLAWHGSTVRLSTATGGFGPNLQPRVLDVACGTGWSSIARPRRTPTAISAARGNAERASVPHRVRFSVSNAADLGGASQRSGGRRGAVPLGGRLTGAAAEAPASVGRLGSLVRSRGEEMRPGWVRCRRRRSARRPRRSPRRPDGETVYKRADLAAVIEFRRT